MKKYLMLAAVSALVFSATNSFAATDKTLQADVFAKIVGVAQVEKNSDMSFGAFVSPSSDTTITLGTGGNVSGTGYISVPAPEGKAPAAAKFTVTGDNDTPYRLSVAETSLSNGTNTMTLKNYKIKVDNGDYVANTNKITDGSDTILVGGDLLVAKDQASGDYAGEITLTVSY